MHPFFERALDILYPPDTACFCCNREALLDERLLCEDCAKEIRLAGRVPRPPYVESMTAGLLYHGPAENAVRRFKYGGAGYLAKPLAGFISLKWGFRPDALLPVPLHKKRRRERGYNQSALLARALADRYELCVEEGLLGRVRDTQPQASLDRAAREQNVRGAFLAEKEVKGRTVLLIDDVVTSGATLRECAHALLAAGAKSVHAACACYAPPGADAGICMEELPFLK